MALLKINLRRHNGLYVEQNVRNEDWPNKCREWYLHKGLNNEKKREIDKWLSCQEIQLDSSEVEVRSEKWLLSANESRDTNK